MEQHPVPQNVTTFQFRLIGDMTVKQFGYLAGGLIGAYICYKLPLPFFFTWPLAGIIGLGGLGFAFVPVEERPMDVWVLSFLKNVYNPTQFIWQKQKKEELPVQTQTHPAQGLTNPLSIFDIFGKKSRHEAAKTPVEPTHPTGPIESHGPPSPTRVTSSSAPKHGMFFDIGQLFLHKSKPGANHPQPTVGHAAHHAQPLEPLPRPAAARPLPRGRTMIVSEWLLEPSQWFSALMKTLSPKKKASVIPPTPPELFATRGPASITGSRLDLNPAQPQIVRSAPLATPREIEQKTTLEHKLASLQQELASKTATDTRLTQLQEQISQALSEKSRMEQEIVSLRQKLSAQPLQTAVRPASVAQPETPSPTVRIVTADMATKAGLPRLTTFPNIITGILKDNTGNLLPGVLVTVRDKDDVPVRALKSNKLGQFAASTPLPNGVFTIDIEDPRAQYIFDRVQLTLTGEVLPAVEITAKNQKQVAREKLAAEIFGKPL